MNEATLKEYYLNPNICEYCNGIIHAKLIEKLNKVRRKRFCNQSCSSKYVNATCIKKRPITNLFCEKCGNSLPYIKNAKGKRLVRRFCSNCLKSIKQKNRWGFEVESIENRYKIEIFSNRKNYQSARSYIQRHARSFYIENNGDMKCLVCGYDTHVDICHIKAVSEFSGECLIKEINSIKNLVALCKNHHWELDNGFLKLGNLPIDYESQDSNSLSAI